MNNVLFRIWNEVRHVHYWLLSANQGVLCMNNVEIKEITYLDPFDIRKK